MKHGSYTRRSIGLKVRISDTIAGRAFPTGFWLKATVLVLLTVVLFAGAKSLASEQAVGWEFNLSAALKETYDSNVYLQNEAARANRDSLVTTLQSQLAARWKASPAFVASLSYQPEVTWFHSEATENFTLHRAVLNLTGRRDDTSYETTTTLVLIDGDSAGLIWTGPGGSPATGGATVRDRRDATVYRSNLRVTHDLGAWFVRPVATFYLHDFQTDHRNPATGYQSFVDRSEVTGGGDVGWRIKSIGIWSGYRYGIQNQARLLQFPEEYDSRFHRVLFGMEGSPVSWLKLNVSLGPEFRKYDHKVAAGFADRDELNLYVDSSITWMPNKSDTITLSARRFEQPGSSGRGVCEDSTYDLGWRHKFNDAWTAGLSGRAYGTAFLKPTQRNDWILSQSAFVNWSITKSLNAEISYTHESGETTTPNASGREFERHLVAVGLKCNFDSLFH